MKKTWNKRFEDSIKKEFLFNNIKRVCVAVSGGADSIAILYILKKLGLEVLGLHCNFHLRGQESNRDMEFVKSFCQLNNITLEIKEFDVRQYLRGKKGESTEMACRSLRYEWFYKRLKETGFDRIVTGHNADDNIETFLLNILRGSGTRGLKGMVKDNGSIWRPLLETHRDNIISYLKENNLDYVVDSTNLENDYKRNFLRNKIIPLLKTEWPGFDSAVDKTIQYIEKENLIIEAAIKENLPSYGDPLHRTTILNFPAPLLLIKRFIQPLGPFTTTPNEVLAAIKANKPHIRKWKLKSGYLYLKYEGLFIEICHSKSGS